MSDRPFSWRIPTLLITGQGLATLSEGALIFGFSLYTLELTGSALRTGLVQFVILLPHLLGLLWGVVIDRYSRQRMILVLNIFRSALALCIPFVLTQNFNLSYLILFLGSAATSLFSSARLSFLPDAVPPDRLPTVNSVDQIVEPLTMFSAATVGGLIVEFLPIQALFLFCAAGYALSALCFGLVPSDKAPTPSRSAYGKGFKEVLQSIGGGWPVILRKPALFYYVPGITGTYIGAGILSALLIIFTKQELALTNFQAAMIQSSNAIGIALAGLLLIAYVRNFNRAVLVSIGFGGAGLFHIFNAFSHSFLPSFIFLLIGGFLNTFSFVGGRLLLHEATPPDMRGRVISAKYALAKTLQALGSLVGSLAVGHGIAGVSQMMLLGGGLIALTGLVGLFIPALVRDGTPPAAITVRPSP